VRKGFQNWVRQKLNFAALGLEKKYQKASPSRTRFLIDFASIMASILIVFSWLLIPWSVLFSDHGAGSPFPADSKTPSFRSGFADLPWVRRSRPAHTMIFDITFSINFPDRLNLVICNKYNAKTFFLPFQASHFSIRHRSRNHFCS
jgi:hypothetical protein